ncbi:MAG: hypothetical protein ACK58M_08630 [Acidobacteriota bacterium]
MRTQSMADPGVVGVTQVYGYDPVNRLTAIEEGGISETNCYDEHGNRAVFAAGGGVSPLLMSRERMDTLAAAEDGE